MSTPDIRHILRVLERKYGHERGQQILAQALQHQKISEADIRDIIVILTDGALARESTIKQKIRKKQKRAAKRSKTKGYSIQNGVRLYQGGAPGLIQQHH